MLWVPALMLVMLAVSIEDAAADPAGPTDYRSSVDAIVPEVAGMEVDILGGDAFVRLEVRGRDVTVLGYRGEPLVRVNRAGEVFENKSSPSLVLNRSRYGTESGSAQDVVPESTSGSPRWRRVGSDGVYIWHDHRAHWMGREPPVGVNRGERILEGVIPLVVDGRPVKAYVSSTWVDPPSPLGVVVGLAVGAVLGVLIVARHVVRPVLGVAAAAALALGLWQFWSLPAATGPSPTLWVLPAVALVLVGCSVRLSRSLRVSASLLHGFAAVELGLWAWTRREGLVRAILPTMAPAVPDRAVTAAVAVVVLVAVGVLVVGRREPIAAQVRAGVPG